MAIAIINSTRELKKNGRNKTVIYSPFPITYSLPNTYIIGLVIKDE